MTYWKLEQDPTWRPYCLACRSMARMEPCGEGFRCGCGNVVDRDMVRIKPRVGDRFRVNDNQFSRAGQVGDIIGVCTDGSVNVDFFCGYDGDPRALPSIENWSLGEGEVLPKSEL